MSMSVEKHAGWRRQLMLAMLIATAVLIPRAILIAHYHAPTRDENYHLFRGLMFLRRDWTLIHSQRFIWNDPPLGDALLSVPAWFNGVHLENPLDARDNKRDVPPPPKNQYVMPDSIQMETAVWQSILFLPALAVIFHWVRVVYSIRSAWLTLAMLLCEPTLAAHLPLPTVDVLGMSGIIITCWCGWRYLVAPSPSRRLLAAAAMGLSLLLKNTALLLPPVLLFMAAIHWIALPLIQHRDVPVRRYVREMILFALTAAVALWIGVFADVSAPFPQHRFANPTVDSLAKIPLPAGIYLRAVISGLQHARKGHSAFLLGHESETGWWYYFPVVATFKVPIGIIVVFVIGIASLLWIKPRYSELPLLICGSAWTLSLMRQHIDIGFRHFLTPEVFWLMLASRCVAVRQPAVTIAVGFATVVSAVQVALFTPDYLSYINFPRRQWYLQISDSNVDWGQATKQLRHWIDHLPDDGRPIYLGYFGPLDQDLFEQLGPRLSKYVMNSGKWISRTPGRPSPEFADLPAHGIFVISPVLITGQYKPGPIFARFRNIPPKEIIGHSLLVYDLDDLRNSNRLEEH
jgi:Dolichyl-phosphate-mannose-protein mannosyltransferase